MDGFRESGGLAALAGRNESSSTTFSTLGVRAATNFSLGGSEITARSMVGWRHAFGDRLPTTQMSFSGSSPFVIAGVPIAKDVAVLELGVEARVARNTTLNVSYSGQFGSGTRENGVQASLTWRF
ncbi:Extracellular serine protease precursor [compost metagenome]